MTSFKFLGSVLLAGTALAALPATVLAKYERTIERTFAVQPGGSLRVDAQGGDIRIVPGSDQEVRITARQKFPRADNEAEADKIMADYTFELSQSGNDVTIVSKRERSLGGWNLSNRVTIDFTVVVPARYAATVRTSGGDIEIGDLTGRVEARTSGGDVDLGRIDGEVEVATSGGDIKLREGTGSARLNTSGGDIDVGRVAGTAEVESSGGDITLRAAGGAVRASTSGGDITATLEGGIPADTSLSTSGGDVVANVARTAAYRLDASTSGGRVEATGLTLTIERGGAGKNRLVGAVNGGGPLLRLRTSGGDIDVRPR